jgi:hypothetical protein
VDVVGGPTAGETTTPGRTVKALAEVAEPPASPTVITPVDAVGGREALTLVDETTVTAVLATPLKLTVTGATKFVPVIVTVEYKTPEAGAKALMVGAAAKLVAAQSESIARRTSVKGRFLGFMAARMQDASVN